MVLVHPDVEEILISEDMLQARVSQLGKQICQDYEGRPLLLIGILKGAAIFLADLARAIECPVDYDFIALSSYGNGTCSSGEVHVIKDLNRSVAGLDIVIVEDIVDTGWTLRLSSLKEMLESQGAACVKVCALLDKPSRREVEVAIDYCGFVIEDHFVVGYGLDWAGNYRNLPYIGILKSEVYSEK